MGRVSGRGVRYQGVGYPGGEDTSSVGTHPTEMLSCCSNIFLLFDRQKCSKNILERICLFSCRSKGDIEEDIMPM